MHESGTAEFITRQEQLAVHRTNEMLTNNVLFCCVVELL